MRQGEQHQRHCAEQHRGVDEGARPKIVPLRLLAAHHREMIGVALEGDEVARPLDALHYVVARVDAEAAADAFKLQPVADVDAGRAYGNASAAIDAIAAAFPTFAFLVLLARLA